MKLRAMLAGSEIPKRAAIACLAAAAMMSAGPFLPFVTAHCIFCPLPPSLGVRSASLLQGLDGWIVLLVVVALALTAASYAMNRQRWAAAASSLGLSIASLGLAIFDGGDAWGRVLGEDAVPPPVSLNGGPPLKGIPLPTTLDVGYYVFLLGALLAVMASVLMLTQLGKPGRTPPLPSR